MFLKSLRKIAPLAIPALFTLISTSSLSPLTQFKQQSKSILTSIRNIIAPTIIECLDTTRANKPQLIKLLNQSKEEVLILIYNRESESQLKDKILKCQQIAEQAKIGKVVLVDQTDIRHLQSFTRILRADIQQQDKKSPKQRQPVNLQNQIKILYITPIFNTYTPFILQSAQTIKQQVQQIRNFIKINPSDQQLRKSIQTYNRTTVIKNCYNDTCVQEYKEKVRQLIELELLRDKSQNYGFYVTNSKVQANKIANTITQSNNKQQIYVFKNDILGKSRALYTQFIQKQGQKYANQNKFMMMIRPRVHILSKKTLNTDLFWFISSLRSNPTPVFSINNTMANLPVKMITGDGDQKQRQKQKQRIMWMKGHVQQVQLIRKLKQRYGQKIQILIVQNNAPFELIRHVFQPQRYCIFSLSPKVPYPKLLIKPVTLNMDVKAWSKIVKIGFNENEQNNKGNQYGKQWKLQVQGDSEDYDQKWDRIIDKVDKFMKQPKNYTPIKIYSQKEIQINADKLKNLLQKSKMTINKSSNNNVNKEQKQTNDNRWVFRVCGPQNNCLYSAYEKYGLGIDVPVYKLDANVQNIDIQQADYQVSGDSIKVLQ